MNPPKQQYKNHILAALPKAGIGRLTAHLSPVTLRRNETLMEGESSYAYFLEDGLASVVVTLEDGTTVEVGVIGKDGVVGLPVLLGAGRMPGRTFIQVAASGYRIKAQRLKEEFERPGDLRRHLQKYLLANLVQSAQNAACNQLHCVAQRLARWLLDCHDRVEADRIPLTHEFLGQMLGTPRPTVTLAAGMLHQAGFIDYARGHVTIKNRSGLEDAACARFGVIRTLQWVNINFSNRCLQFGKDKTPSGTGRIIPLNSRAMATLSFWASRFPERQPEHYVFPAERYGGSGAVFGACVYWTDPTRPIGSIKEAWEAAKLRAGVKCRFHDLRHTAVSRMLDAGVPIAKVAKIVGWSPATMVRMAARYGHFALEELRSAVDSISRTEIQRESPVFPPVQETVVASTRAN